VSRRRISARKPRRRALRRPGIILGRRFAFATAVVLAALAALEGSPARADNGDLTVVSATIYGAQGSVSHPSVTVGTLTANNCQTADSPIYLYPGDQPAQLAVNSQWSLATVLQCALGLPVDTGTSVQVLSPAHGFEAPLSYSELTDPTQYDPQALPVVSIDGGEDQVTYARPWLGGSDQNAVDSFVSTAAPVAIVVWESGSILSVRPSDTTISQTDKTMTEQFSATVQTAGGTAVPAASLQWQWNFNDGATSTEAAPQHSFVPGVYYVTVEVSDPVTGAGGTATIEVSAAGAPATGSGTHTGGPSPSNGKAPAGPQRSSGTHAGGPAGKSKATPTGASSKTHNAKGPTSETTTAPASSPTTTASSKPAPVPAKTPTASRTAATTAPRLPAPPPHAAVRLAGLPAPSQHQPQSLRPHGPIVAGELISDVAPVAADVSPLVHTVSAPVPTAPAVRRAGTATPWPAVGAGLLALLVFGLGAAHELRGRRTWRNWRDWRGWRALHPRG
jgi:hypothetical protein